MQYQQGVVFRPIAALLTLTILAACNNDQQNQDSGPLVNTDPMTLTGSIGDGPVSAAAIRILDAQGQVVASGMGSPSANYQIVVPAQTAYPITIEATGGTDLVTGQPLDMTLRTAVLDPNADHVNVSPLTTLATRVASCDSRGLGNGTLDGALKEIRKELGMGLDPHRVKDPINGTIDGTDVADVVLANEALGEALRRTGAALADAGAPISADDLLDHLACDVADGGGVDGSVASIDARTLAAFHAASAAVLIEEIAGQLHVNGVNATGAMDDALGTVVEGTTASVADVPVDRSLVDRALASLGILQTTFDDPAIARLMFLLGETDAADVRSAISGALDASTFNTINGLVARAVLADDDELASIKAAAADVSSTGAPKISISADPKSIDTGTTTLVSWATTDAKHCVASGAWTGEQALSGSHTTAQLNASATYTLSCEGLGGTTSKSASVQVTTPTATSTPPAVSISANPTSVTAGGSSMLTWSTTDATSCTASGGWSGSRGTSGTESTGALSSTASFTLACTGAGGNASASTSVTVSAAPPPAPTLTFAANPTSVDYNGGTQLTWSTTDATGCTASGDWSGKQGASGSSSRTALTANKTYTLTCSGDGGSVSKTVNVTVGPAPAPTLTLTANPTSIANGASSMLTWSTTNATGCTASGDWTGSQATSGSSNRTGLTANKTFTLTCQGAGGSIAKSATVTVAPPAAPTVTFTANPTSVAYNGSTTLNWSTTNATSCTASGAWTGAQSMSGSSTKSSLTANASYTLTCQGAGGSTAKTVDVTVAPPPAPTVSLSANPMSIAYNASTQLTWSSTNATSCTASGGWTGTKSTSGNQTISSLTANATFTLACTGAGGTTNQSVSVTVGAAPAPTVSLSANPTSVASGGSTSLTWSSTNATSCTASGGWTGTKATSGGETISNLTSNTTFTLACSGAGGNASQNASVTVTAASPTVTLTANPTWVDLNGSSTLTWSSANATACTASGGWSGSKGTSGSQSTGGLGQDTTYSISCSGSGGSAVSMTSVGVRVAQLTWTAPTQNTDGSALTSLAGYKIYYGTASQSYSQTKSITGASTTQTTVTLTPGTWFFAMTAIDGNGTESAKTNEVSKTVN